MNADAQRPAPHDPASDTLPLTPETLAALSETSRWVLMLAFLGQIFAGTAGVLALLLASVKLPSLMRANATEIINVMLYFLLGVIILTAALLLRRFGHALDDLCLTRTQTTLREAIVAQLALWRVWCLILVGSFAAFVVAAAFMLSR